MKTRNIAVVSLLFAVGLAFGITIYFTQGMRHTDEWACIDAKVPVNISCVDFSGNKTVLKPECANINRTKVCIERENQDGRVQALIGNNWTDCKLSSSILSINASAFKLDNNTFQRIKEIGTNGSFTLFNVSRVKC